MHQHIKLCTKKDIEIGLQLGIDKLAITKVDEHIPGIENWLVNSLIASLVLGFIYLGE